MPRFLQLDPDAPLQPRKTKSFSLIKVNSRADKKVQSAPVWMQYKNPKVEGFPKIKSTGWCIMAHYDNVGYVPVNPYASGPVIGFKPIQYIPLPTK